MAACNPDGRPPESCPTQVRATPPFYGPLHLMTFNINGMFTKIQRVKKRVRKYAVLSKYLSAVSIDFACI